MHAQGFGAGSSPVVSFRPSLSPMLRSRRPKLTCRSTPVLASGCASFWSALHHDGLRHTGPHWAKRGTGGAHIIARGCGRWLALDVNTLHCTARPAARAGGLFDAWGLHYNAVRRDIEAAKKTTKKTRFGSAARSSKVTTPSPKPFTGSKIKGLSVSHIGVSVYRFNSVDSRASCRCGSRDQAKDHGARMVRHCGYQA